MGRIIEDNIVIPSPAFPHGAKVYGFIHIIDNITRVEYNPE
jgi:hypothetical protein